MKMEYKLVKNDIHPDYEAFVALVNAKMPFGKYKGLRLVDLPEPYIVWLSQKGFQKGKLGEMLRTIYEIKFNGLEYFFIRPFRNCKLEFFVNDKLNNPIRPAI